MKPEESFIGQPIRSLQTMLRTIAENDEEYLPLIPDGIYGPETMSAVSRFQKKHGLPVTGITNQETWDTIVPIYEQALIEQADAEPLAITLHPKECIHCGDQNDYLYLAQAMLLAFSKNDHCLDAPEMTGILDAATEDALCSFQQMCGLPISGNLDKQTWKHMALQYPGTVSRSHSRSK